MLHRSTNGTNKSWPVVAVRPSNVVEEAPDGENFSPDDTFYANVNLKDYKARKAEHGDILRIKTFLTEDDYEFFKFENPYMLLEKCCCCMVLAEALELDRIVAAAFFDDCPIDPVIKMGNKKWKGHPELEHMTPLNTLFLRLYAGSQELAYDTCLTEIVANAFLSCPHVNQILVEIPDKTYSGILNFHPMVKQFEFAPEHHVRRNVLIYDKNVMFPSLIIREGREHDLDDLSSLLPMDPKTVEEQFGKNALSDVIALAEKTDVSMVAEWGNEARGIVTVTTNIDYEVLNENFHLENFHGLYKPHPGDELHLEELKRPLIRAPSIPFSDLWSSSSNDSATASTEDSEYSKVYSVEFSQRPRHEVDENDADRSDDSDLELDDYDSDNAQHHLFGRRVSKDLTRYGLRPPDDGCDGSIGIAKVIATRLETSPPGAAAGPPQHHIKSKVIHPTQSKYSELKGPTGKLETYSNLNSEDITSTSGVDNSDSARTDASKITRKVLKKKKDFDFNDFNTSRKPATDYSKLGAEIVNFLGYESPQTERLSVIIAKAQTSTKTMKKLVPKKKVNLGQYFFEKEAFVEMLRDSTLMTKIRHIYLKLKEAGVRWETARELMKARDLERPRMQIGMTRELLMEYLALITPDDRMHLMNNPKAPTKPIFYGIPNAIAIQIFTIKQKYKIRTDELLKGAFSKFPNKEYLIVTVPIGTKEPSWLNYFVRVPPKPGSCMPLELFVLHKAYLNTHLRVRKVKQDDLQKIEQLLEGMQDAHKILADLPLQMSDSSESAVTSQSSGEIELPKMEAFVAEAPTHPDKPIIGLIIASHESRALAYQVHFNLEESMYTALHDEDSHGYMHHLVILPIFQKFEKQFVKEVMRIMKKDLFYQRIYPSLVDNQYTIHQTNLSTMDEWIPVAPRKLIDYDYLHLDQPYDVDRRPPDYITEDLDPYSLVYTSKKLSLDPKIVCNVRVIIVGASETGLSCIEKMICSPFRHFRRLTLVDPYGLPGTLPENMTRNIFFDIKTGGKATCSPTFGDYVKRIGARSWVNVVCGSVTKIDRRKKMIVVDNKSVMPYDILVLTPGRQFIRPDCPLPEINNPNFQAFKDSTTGKSAKYDNRVIFNKSLPKPKNVFLINTEAEAQVAMDFLKMYLPASKNKKILVFGACLESYLCINALLSMGIPPRKIVFITSQEKIMEWEEYIDYKDLEKLKDSMIQTITEMDINVITNYEFQNWELCPVSGFAKRIRFVSDSEGDSNISFLSLAIFSYRYKRVHDDIASALTEAYVLYQGGIVIDENFKTNDPYILAAGPAAIYKKILISDSFNHMYCQSEEVGAALSHYVLQSVRELQGMPHPPDSITHTVKKFIRPFVRACTLPGNWNFLFIRKPGLAWQCTSEEECEEICDCSTEIVTGSVDVNEDPNQNYFKMTLDERSRVSAIECISKSPFSVANMIGVYGQHETLLNRLLERLEKGEILDLYQHFSQPWFSVFCLNEWLDFKQELQLLYKDYNLGNGQRIADFIKDFLSSMDNPDALKVDPDIIRSVWECSGLKQAVELRFLNFLKFHKQLVPMYARHDYVEDLLEERATSSLYNNKLASF